MSEKHGTSSKQKPLMYIAQPNFTPTPGGMQQSFVVKQGSSVLEEGKQGVKQDVQKVKEEKNIDQPVSESKRDRKKRFTEMNIEERIEFFVKLPENLPKTMCQITTKDQSYKGVIIGINEGLVSVRTLTSPKKVEIHLDDIEAINVIGF